MWLASYLTNMRLRVAIRAASTHNNAHSYKRKVQYGTLQFCVHHCLSCILTTHYKQSLHLFSLLYITVTEPVLWNYQTIPSCHEQIPACFKFCQTNFIKMTVFWDIALCRLVEAYLRFRGATSQKTVIFILATMRT
jgi:hypothetical protein